MADITDTTRFPAYPDSGGKAALMADIQNAMKRADWGQLQYVLFRLSNTDTSGFNDATATLPTG